ncbi:MAG: cob(I)yrinic acid a,c-diamide adenosyltransferase [Planctomycetes bacterium]|nr:cob(I)yrinic acid a,c-diamide adenosyltransferase [Planctomycetota bacterium]
MQIYTRTGDDGTTGVFGGPRVRKDHPRIEAYGTVDELNATLGLARSHTGQGEFEDLLREIQSELFDVGAELATPDPQAHGLVSVGTSEIERLEKTIDRWQQVLPPLTKFILPAGTPLAAALHLARTVCRRAEREVIGFAQAEPGALREALIQYLNRLGDLLFVLARSANYQAGRTDELWQRSSNRR